MRGEQKYFDLEQTQLFTGFKTPVSRLLLCYFDRSTSAILTTVLLCCTFFLVARSIRKEEEPVNQ